MGIYLVRMVSSVKTKRMRGTKEKNRMTGRIQIRILSLHPLKGRETFLNFRYLWDKFECERNTRKERDPYLFRERKLDDASRQCSIRWSEWVVGCGYCRWIIYSRTGSLRLPMYAPGKKFKLKYWVHIDHMLKELRCCVLHRLEERVPMNRILVISWTGSFPVISFLSFPVPANRC